MTATDRLFPGIAAVALIATLFGCSQDQPTAPSAAAPSATPSAPSSDGAKFLLAEEPAGAQDVVAVRADAKNDDEIVVAGRIGGAVNPWVDGLAAFTLVDASAKACGETEDDTCPTPWDFCCEPGLGKKKISVEFVDEQGTVVAADAKTLLGVKELDSVVIRGKARRDEAGNITVLATGLYVKK
jgi:hypothetical protein